MVIAESDGMTLLNKKHVEEGLDQKSLQVKKDMPKIYGMLSERVDLYCQGYKLAKEMDENCHRDRNFDNEVERQKVIEQETGCQFI